MDPISEATNAIGTLHTNGRTTIMSSVRPGPDDETTSSMPNEPEQVSVNTTTTAVIQPHPDALQALVAQHLCHSDPPE